MIALAIWPLVFAIGGALLYALSANGKVSELGRIVFGCGFLVLTWTLARATLELSRQGTGPHNAAQPGSHCGGRAVLHWCPNKERRTGFVLYQLSYSPLARADGHRTRDHDLTRVTVQQRLGRRTCTKEKPCEQGIVRRWDLRATTALQPP